MKNNKLSVCIITLNEEKHVGKCVESVLGIADEIIVVDSGSTDKTVDIAKKLGSDIFVRKFDNYANQKNYAADKAKNEWVLFMDADEILEDGAEEEILKVIQNPKYQAYSMPRKNIILGKLIKYTRWQPELDRHVWLFKKGRGKWAGEVHEEVLVSGGVGKLKKGKIHYQYESVSEFTQMMNLYSSIESQKRFKRGDRFSFIKIVVASLYNFFVRYFYRLGFLDGWRGFVLSYLMGIYHLQVGVKLWELSKND